MMTPGPWRHAPNCNGIEGCEIRGSSDELIADVYDAGDGSHRIGNARVLAAAPELLAALKDCVEFQGCGDPDCCDAARAQVIARQRAQDAIAKAEGK